MADRVNDKIKEMLTVLELKMRTFLKLCDTPEERVFLVTYFQSVMDNLTADWFNYESEPSGLPIFQYPGYEEYGNFVPAKLKWYEPNNMDVRKFLKPHWYELIPKFRISDEQGNEICKIDFALLYPRSDRIPVKIKVAISFSRKKSRELTEADRVKAAYLQSNGWIVAHFTGDEFASKNIQDLIDYVEDLAIEKDEKLFYETKQQRENWQLN